MKRNQPLPPRVGPSRAGLLRIGLLGGGQLARMLALKGHEMGLEIHVLSASPEDPAAQVVRHHHKGDVASAQDLKGFLSQVDVATFESEFMDADLLARLANETNVPIRPRPDLMGRIQDRLEQKELLKKQKLPTAPFYPVSQVADAERALKRLGGRMVLKKRRFGYDGYGTFIVKSASDLTAVTDTIESDKHGFIAEAFVPFRREVALMGARRPSGQSVVLPLVETKQENSRCLWVKGPLTKVEGSVRLISRFKAFLEAIRYEGIMGVELFQTDEGLLVNELAPRVHNSAHYSLDALDEDQFTLHLKAVLDLPFGPVLPLAKGFAMYNLLGAHDRAPSWQIPEGVHLHWYGKTENRRGRKMGHLNAIAPTAKEALARLTKARAKFDV